MTDKSIIIIGAGLAGLATGCYGQMNGYKTSIFERQPKPGGVCTSWSRKGYTFDYTIHNLFGITSDSADNVFWREIGALKDLKIHSFKEFVQVEDNNGKKFTVYTNLDALERHMIMLSPKDQKKIREFVNTCRRFSRYDLFAALTGGIGTKIRMLPILGSLMKYSKITLDNFAQEFNDSFLRKAIPTIQYDLPQIPTVIPLIFLATMSKGDGGWPIGGSLALSKNIEKRYLELGGQIAYNSTVTKVIVDNHKAVGIQLENGQKHFANYIVSAADGYNTIFKMLEAKYVSDSICEYYKSFPKTIPFGLEVWYGVNLEFNGEPHALVLFLDKPLMIEDREYNKLDVEIFNFDPSLAPPGKTVIKVVMDSNYEYWKKLSTNPKAYKEEKSKIADIFAEKLDKRFPGFKNHIETVDVATPISVEHWTDAYRGYSVPYPAPEKIAKKVTKNGLSKTLPGLQNFHMVGQWAGALYSTNQVCLMGRNLIQQLCKADNKKFLTTTAD